MEQQKINYDTLNVALGNEPGLLVGFVAHAIPFLNITASGIQPS